MKSLEEVHREAMMGYQIARLKQLTRLTSMMESLPSTVADADEDDWTVISQIDKKFYTAPELDTLRGSARKLQYTAAGRGIIQTFQDFVIGRNASIEASDENEQVQEYWDEWVKANNWDMRSKEIIKRTVRDGECILRWFLPKRGSAFLIPRFVDPAQIKPSRNGKPTYGIKTNKDDIEEIISLHREWATSNNQQREDILIKDVDFLKILCDSDDKRGVSFFIGIAKYMKHYEKWIEDRIEINRIRHIWNVVAEVEGLTLEEVKAQFPDTEGKTPSGGTPKKKYPKPGTVMLNKGIKWDLKNLQINAQDTKEDGRLIQLMIGLGTGLPEYVVRGDASNSNYASTMISESPFVRAMESWQDIFADYFQKIFARVISYGISKIYIPSKSFITTELYNRETGEATEKKEPCETSKECEVNFSTLLHRDIEKETKSFQIMKQEQVMSKRTIQEKLGLDPDEENDRIDKEGREEEKKNEREFDMSQKPEKPEKVQK